VDNPVSIKFRHFVGIITKVTEKEYYVKHIHNMYSDKLADAFLRRDFDHGSSFCKCRKIEVINLMLERKGFEEITRMFPSHVSPFINYVKTMCQQKFSTTTARQVVKRRKRRRR
jgi:hypothetical protein